MMQGFFYVLLLLCFSYTLLLGGWEGRVTVGIFLCSFILTLIATPGPGKWTQTSYGVMAVDTGCMIALALVALASRRGWTIWVFGFQVASVATHLATLATPIVSTKAYYAFNSFWSIAEMAVMIAGIAFDRRHDRYLNRS